MIGDGQNLLLVCPHTKYWAVQQLFIQLSMSITQDTTSFLDFLNLDMSNPPSPPIPDLDDYNINPFSPPASLPPMTSIPISRPASQTTQPMEQWVTRLLPMRHLWSYPSSAVGKGVNRREELDLLLRLPTLALELLRRLTERGPQNQQPNNASEGSNNAIKHAATSDHPNIWSFIPTIRAYNSEMEQKLLLLWHGVDPERPNDLDRSDPERTPSRDWWRPTTQPTRWER